MQNHRWQNVVALAILGVAIGAAPEAKANVLATATRTTDVTNNTNLPVLLPLNDAGSTTLTFSTTKNRQKVVIVYNAECAAVAGTTSKFLSVSVLVDGNSTSPNS